ncbi:MAG: glycosyl hydrolase [Terriglobia bacterium]
MRKVALAAAMLLALSGGILAAESGQKTDELASNFLSPPDSAKPWAYWLWLNGNVTKEGITKDLEEMKRQGINGVLVFQAGDGKTPAGAQFFSPQWHELFQHALREAARLEMVVSIDLCDGWDSGGLWITQDQANKKLVYSELQVDGAKKLDRLLPLPPVVDNYYHDVAVLAIREKASRPVAPAMVTASSTLQGYVGEWNFYPQDAVDGDPETYWSSRQTALSPSDPTWLAFDFDNPLQASSIYLLPGPDSGPRECELQASQDGKTFTSVTRFSLEKGQGKRVDFPTVRSRHFRLVMTSAYGTPVQMAEAVLLRQGDEPILRRGIKWWWFKSGNRSFWDYPRQGPAALDEEYPQDGAVDCRSKEVVDLTAFTDADGRMSWDVPPGRWTILRFGYTLEGQQIRGTSRNTQGGYEADMLDRAGIESHFVHTALPVLADAEGSGTHVLKYLHIDSYELGADVRGQQPTWSRTFREEFKKRRGYDLLPYLPAMARRIVDSREVTNRFLFDVRWTIGDLMAEQFWIPFGELAHQRGIGIQSETGYGTYPYPHIDGLRCAGNNDLPMGEFWFGTDIMSQFNPWGNVIRTVATAAHVYGRPVVQAESFTAWTHWQEYPQSLKPVGDQAFLDGLNRMVFHQYTAQPMLEMKPGWQYGAGTHFDRNITWWEEARGFFQYLARCQYLLQKGRFDADALYFYGEGVTKFLPSREYLRPALPEGYNFDALDSELLLHGLAIDHGRWTLPSGMSYRVLVLPQDGVMSATVLRRIRELVEEGGVVFGPRPQRPPGLQGYPGADPELKKLADEMWGDIDGLKVKERSLGKGRIYSGESLREVFAQQSIAPDFVYRSSANGALLDFLHRSQADAEVYFLSNRNDRDERAECTFRVSGKRPELWDPVTGESRPAAAFKQADGRTSVPLEFAPYGSLFVVFRQPMGVDVRGEASRNFPVYSNGQEIQGPWAVSFDPQWGGPADGRGVAPGFSPARAALPTLSGQVPDGATLKDPASVEFEKLISWTERSEDGIKYYSGTATYRKSFDLPLALRGAHARVALDLGDVKYVAQVRLNGKDLGPLWTKPFRVEITDAVKPSGNVLEIDVANLWPNRIIGDSRLPPERRYTHTNVVYKQDTPLWESGLLGPAKLELIEDNPR